MHNIEDIEKDVQNILNQTADQLFEKGVKDNTHWTRDIKTALAKLAWEKYGFLVWTGKNNDFDDTNEWLYDMVWYDSFDEKGFEIKNIYLILESEWDKSLREIKYDFYKLIQGRANIRVMIFQSDKVDNTFNELVKTIQSSPISQVGDKYLLVGWNDDYGFTFKSHIHQV